MSDEATDPIDAADRRAQRSTERAENPTRAGNPQPTGRSAGGDQRTNEEIFRQMSPSQLRAFGLGPDPARQRRDRDDAWQSVACWWSNAPAAQGPPEFARSMIQAYFTYLAEGFSLWSRMAERWADLVQAMAGGFPAFMCPGGGRADDRMAGADDWLARLASMPEPGRSQLIALLRSMARTVDPEMRRPTG